MDKLIGANMFPSLLKDPFNKECIDSIWVSMGKNIFTKKAQFSVGDILRYCYQPLLLYALSHYSCN